MSRAKTKKESGQTKLVQTRCTLRTPPLINGLHEFDGIKDKKLKSIAYFYPDTTIGPLLKETSV